MRDLTGQDLATVEPPPTKEELAQLRERAPRFIDREFQDEILTPAQVTESERKAKVASGEIEDVPDPEGEQQ